MKRTVILLAAALVFIFSGCTSAGGRLDNTQSNIAEETVRQDEAKDTEKDEGKDELVFSFVGDMMFDRSVAAYIKAKGEDYVFQGYEKQLRDSDIVFGNLETPFSSRGQPVPDKQYTFRSSPKLAPYLKKYNFTALSIANNHVLDYGHEAFLDTLKILEENGISYGGGGRSKTEALDGIVVEKKGLKIGFIAFTGVTPSVDWYAGGKKPGIIGAYKVHEPEVLDAVKNLRQKCDLLVVSLHWGKEGSTAVRKEETEFAHKLVDTGADLIFGHHPHVVKGIELYKGKPIFYSLGNFIFTASKSEICNKTIMAVVRYDSTGTLKSVKAVPGIIKWGRPVPMEEEQSREFMDYLNGMNINIKL